LPNLGIGQAFPQNTLADHACCSEKDDVHDRIILDLEVHAREIFRYVPKSFGDVLVV
jgi:hypothetical protein